MSYTPGGPGPGPDNYGFGGDGGFNRNNQGGDNTGSPWLQGNDNPYAYNGASGDRPGWRDAGPMQFTSSDGRTIYNIQNAYFPISPGQIAESWGGYNPANNPQFENVNPEIRNWVSMNAQNIWNAQQEPQVCMASERWAQDYPPQNYWSEGYRQGWVPPYYAHRRHCHGPEFSISANPFYSGYNPGYAQGPMIQLSIGGHGRGGLRIFT